MVQLFSVLILIWKTCLIVCKLEDSVEEYCAIDSNHLYCRKLNISQCHYMFGNSLPVFEFVQSLNSMRQNVANGKGYSGELKQNIKGSNILAVVSQ